MLDETAATRAPLHRLAHGRTGDKGNRINISVIPYDPRSFELIADQVTEELVRAHFAHRGVTAVARYDLPSLPAFNFVLDNVLEGGVNGSLNLDGHGKCLAFHLLALEIELRPVNTRPTSRS